MVRVIVNKKQHRHKLKMEHCISVYWNYWKKNPTKTVTTHRKQLGSNMR